MELPVIVQIILTLVAAYILMKSLCELARFQSERQHMKFYREDRKSGRDRPPQPAFCCPAAEEKHAKEKRQKVTGMTEITCINEIPDDETGGMLLTAISIITTESRKSSTPDEVLIAINKRRIAVKEDIERIEKIHGKIY